MTGFTSQGRAIGAALRHAVLELAVVHVEVTRGAAHVLPMKGHDLVAAAGRADFVAIGAGHRRMRPREDETGVAMLRNRKSGAVKIQNGVAILAFVQIRGGGELAIVRILVAVRAKREFHLVNGVLASGQMALVAGHGDVLALQGIFGGVMLFHPEKRGFPPVDGVTLRAFAFPGTRFELAFMRIGFVAVHAVRKRQGLLEITVQVACRTANHGMLPEERVLCLRMVEFKTRKQFFPPRSGVTLFAALFERPLMGIDVAVDASLKLHVLVTRRPAGDVRLVAFLAGDLNVLAGQRVAGLGVIELLGRFPVREIMALQTVVSQLAFVHIFVARLAVLRQPEERLRKILHLDERAILAGHVSRGVTFFAGDPGVLAFQLVPRQTVVELLLGGLPVDQAELFAVMIQVATNTISPVGVGHLELEVITVLGRQSLGDFLVAIQALESGRAGPELVATRALRGAA